MAVVTGLQALVESDFAALAGKRIGLISNHTGVDARLTGTADILAAQGSHRLAALFGPEHGIRGDASAGESVASSRDALTGLPVYSLYGETNEPRPEWLAGLDALVYDIQDIGARFYTYIQTLAAAMAAAGKAGIEFIVLDRPTPIDGLTVEGTTVEPGFESFVGLFPLASRPGLTVGELARLYIAAGWVRPAPELTVIPLCGWRRSMYYDETGLPWVPPSPAAATLDMAILYPGTCLFEGTNVSEGRGTTRPFETIGAPFVDGWALRRELGEVPGALLRPHFFQPRYHKYADEVCGGVQIHIIDRHAYRPVETGLRLIAALLRLYPGRFEFTTDDGVHYFDTLCGTDRVRRSLLVGRDAGEILAGFADQLASFRLLREEALLYHE